MSMVINTNLVIPIQCCTQFASNPLVNTLINIQSTWMYLLYTIHNFPLVLMDEFGFLFQSVLSCAIHWSSTFIVACSHFTHQNTLNVVMWIVWFQMKHTYVNDYEFKYTWNHQKHPQWWVQHYLTTWHCSNLNYCRYNMVLICI